MKNASKTIRAKSPTQMRSNLTEGPVRKLLIVMTVPMMIGLFFSMGFNLVDTYFVAQLGTSELAALSFTFPVIMLVVATSIGLGAGASSVLSRAIGKDDQDEVRRLTIISLMLGAILSFAMTILGLLTIDPLFRALGATDDLLPLIREYVTPFYWAVFFMIGGMIGASAMRSTGNTKLQSRIMIWTAVFNAIIDPFMIFDQWTIPGLDITITGLGLGLQGAAYATVISRGLYLLACLYYLMFRFDMLRFEKITLEQMRNSSRDILRISIPAAGTNMIIPVAGGVLVALIARYGEAAVAGFGVATRIEALTLIIFFALSSVIGPFVGQNMGANKPERIGEAIKNITLFCIIIGIVNAALLYLFSTEISSWFTDNEDALKVAALYLSIVPISYMGHGLVMSVNATFNAVGRPLPGVVISVTRTVILQIPFAFIGGYFFGIYGIFIGTALGNLLSGILAYYFVKFITDRVRERMEENQLSIP